MQALEQSACIVSCGGAPLSLIKQYFNQQRPLAVAADQPTPPSEPLQRLHREQWLEFGRNSLTRQLSN